MFLGHPHHLISDVISSRRYASQQQLKIANLLIQTRRENEEMKKMIENQSKNSGEKTASKRKRGKRGGIRQNEREKRQLVRKIQNRISLSHFYSTLAVVITCYLVNVMTRRPGPRSGRRRGKKHVNEVNQAKNARNNGLGSRRTVLKEPWTPWGRSGDRCKPRSTCRLSLCWPLILKYKLQTRKVNSCTPSRPQP